MSVRAQQRSPLRSAQDLVCLGRIGGPRGLKGEVRIRAFTQHARDIAAYGPVTDKSGNRSFTLTVVSETGDGGLIARLSGINDRSGAEKLKGLKLFVARAALPRLPAGEYYHSDLIDLAALDMQGRVIGRVAAIHDFGAGGILEIEPAGNDGGKAGEELWPAASIARVDLAAGKLVLAERTEILAAPEQPRRKHREARGARS